MWLLSVQEYVTLHARLPSSAAVAQLHRRLRCSHYLNTATSSSRLTHTHTVLCVRWGSLKLLQSRGSGVGGCVLPQSDEEPAELRQKHRDSSRESNPAVTMTGEMDGRVGGGCGWEFREGGG